MTTGPASSSTQATLDATLTIALAVASKAAYDYYQGLPFQSPDGYQQINAWTGWDAFLISGSEEKYGLVFQSIADPGSLIFAFRGTDSDMDIYEDIRFLTTEFVPSSGTVAPTPHVASGFYSIYDDKGGSMTQSMRQQLFALLAKYTPSELYVTGHSLGAALSQLFSLDLAISQPMNTVNINFSSPMVGTLDWQTAYNATIPAANSIRVYNYWDYVPTLPPSDLGFHAVGSAFQTAFYVKGEWFPHELSRHSVVNLTTVLSHALPANPQQWGGQFPDYIQPKWTMLSKLPPAGGDVSWVDKIGEHMRFERSLRAAA